MSRIFVCVVVAISIVAPSSFAVPEEGTSGGTAVRPGTDQLLYFDPPRARAAIRDDVESGRIADPKTKLWRQPPPAATSPSTGRTGGLTASDIFPYEDTNSILISPFSDGQLLALMADAANALVAVHGDNYDFIGYWLNFEPDHEIGAAFYMPIFNDVSGIGDPSTVGTPIFDDRPTFGLNTTKIEGYIMMWNINESYWQPGNTGAADFTRLALAQEFEHRWALFLPNLLDGRIMQGIESGCGRQFHWSWKIDNQGSAMELSEWVNSSPAALVDNSISFNTDIAGGVFSYADLYLMGYVSPAEMDANSSEIRFMDNANCALGTNYFGTISTFDSSDIIASAGARSPDHTQDQKDYRTGWVMFHLPGSPPTVSQINKAIQIHEQHQIDWRQSTLLRGTMDHSLDAAVSVPGASDPVGPAGRIVLGAPRPNPTTGAASISLTLERDAALTVTVHDVAGRLVADLGVEMRDAGVHSVQWDGRTASGSRAPAGSYFVRVSDGTSVVASRVLVLR